MFKPLILIPSQAISFRPCSCTQQAGLLMINSFKIAIDDVVSSNMHPGPRGFSFFF